MKKYKRTNAAEAFITPREDEQAQDVHDVQYAHDVHIEQDTHDEHDAHNEHLADNEQYAHNVLNVQDEPHAHITHTAQDVPITHKGRQKDPNQKRDCRLHLLLTETDKQKLSEYAWSQHMSLNDVIASWIKEKCC